MDKKLTEKETTQLLTVANGQEEGVETYLLDAAVVASFVEAGIVTVRESLVRLTTKGERLVIETELAQDVERADAELADAARQFAYLEERENEGAHSSYQNSDGARDRLRDAATAYVGAISRVKLSQEVGAFAAQLTKVVGSLRPKEQEILKKRLGNDYERAVGRLNRG